MDNNKGMIGLAVGSWLVAFAGGTLAGTLLWVLGGWSFLQGAFVGALVFVVVGALVSWIMTRPLPGPGEVKLNAPSAAKTPAGVAVAPKSAPKPATKPAPAPKPEPAAVKAEPKEAAQPALAEAARPTLMLDAPRGGKADDLKKITGVGPKLEQTLNELGIWHFEQVAQLTKDEIAWVDERLRFKGRIERDDWIGQARELAKAKG